MPFTQAARRAIARIIIPRYFEMGYSATAALKAFRVEGEKLQTKLWHATWREITGAKKLERAYRFIPIKHRLSYNMMAPTETYQATKFKFIFETHGYDTALEQGDTRVMSYGTDERISPEEAADRMAQQIRDEVEATPSLQDFEPDMLELYVVYRRKE